MWSCHVHTYHVLCNDLFRYNQLRTHFVRKGVMAQSVLRMCRMNVVYTFAYNYAAPHTNGKHYTE